MKFKCTSSKDTRRIPLTQGKFSIVDAIDYDWLMQWKWCANFTGRIWYAIRGSGPRVNRKTILMHREIANRIKLNPSPRYDHKDGNGLHNTRINIRPCTPSQNQANRRKTPGTSSKYKGVTWHKPRHLWRAQIMVNRKNISLGYFQNEKEAAMAYSIKAKQFFGEYARF